MSSQMAGMAQALLGQLGVSLYGQQQLLGELGALMQTLRQPPGALPPLQCAGLHDGGSAANVMFGLTGCAA
jgi:hypothetical protein